MSRAHDLLIVVAPEDVLEFSAEHVKSSALGSIPAATLEPGTEQRAAIPKVP